MKSIVRLGWLILRDLGILFHLSVKSHYVCHNRVMVGLVKLAAIAFIELN